MNGKRSEIINQASLLKREGRLHEAIAVCGVLLEEDRFDPEAYSMIGKIYYLLDDYDAASRYFLCALQLEILNASDEREKNESYRKETDELIESSMNPVVAAAGSGSSIKFILLFGHTLIHLAHSLADKSLVHQNKEERDLYKDIISGKTAESNEKYKKIQNEFYFNVGLIFAVAALDMNLRREEVMSAYFSFDSYQLQDLYSESLNVLEKIR